MNSPLLTIGIPTYNGANRIATAINSALNQSYENIEVLISDNGSTDNTREVCEAFVAQDSRIVYHRQAENRGIIPNFQYTLDKASGKYFIWVSDDDEIKPDILSTYVEFLEANPDYGLVCAETNYWDGDRHIWKEEGLSIGSNSAIVRTIKMYWKNKGGSIVHGLFRTEIGQRQTLRSVLGSDWFFAAGLAYLGKFKQLDFVGMNKELGGASENHRKLARLYGEHPIWGYIPYLRITQATFADVMWANPGYNGFAFIPRLITAIGSSMAVFSRYYFDTYPRTLAGKLLRLLKMKTPTEMKSIELNPEKAFSGQEE